MSTTARRDGTPEDSGNRPSRAGFRSRSVARKRTRNNGRSTSRDAAAHGTTGVPTQRIPSVSYAKPARHQHVSRAKASALRSEYGAQGIRLQKVLAQAGVGSRRVCEQFIDDGRVEVNGSIVTRQGMRVDPNNAVVRVDGVRIRIDETLQYFALNKPRGMQCTMSDDMGRPCVGDIIDERISAGQRLFHVGRLDADTEGLLLLTNDGELANRLMHPKYEVSKTYLAEVLGEPDRGVMRQLLRGVELDDGCARADKATVLDANEGRSLVRIDIHEGRKHVVRRMLKAVGFPVQRLVRTKVHTVQLGEQRPGKVRALNDSEVRSLYKAVDM